MSTDTIAIAGGLASAALTCLYGYNTLFYNKVNKQRLPGLMILPAFAWTIVYWFMLRDAGFVSRLDGINYQMAYWLAATATLTFGSALYGFYLWFPFVDGWGNIFMGAASGVGFAICGRFSDNARFGGFAIAATAHVLWIANMLYRYFYVLPETAEDRVDRQKRKQKPDGPESTQWRMAFQWLSVGAFHLSYTAAALVFLLGPEMTRQLNNTDVYYGLQLAFAMISLLAPLLASAFHQPQDSLPKAE
jgi:hypothetical protein